MLYYALIESSSCSEHAVDDLNGPRVIIQNRVPWPAVWPWSCEVVARSFSPFNGAVFFSSSS